MLVIRPEQMAVLAEVARRELEKRAVDHLRASHGDLPSIETFVRDEVTRAAAAGFALEHEILEYLDIAATLGAEFETSQVRQVLAQTRLSPGVRLHTVRGLMRERT